MTPDPKTEALKPCPCCGGGAEVMSRFDVKCTACGLEINSLSPERDWNTRAPAIERDAEAAALREALEQIAYGDIFDVTMRQIATAALASTAGTDFAERLRKAEEERDEAHRELLIQAEQHKQATALMSESALKALRSAESDRDALAKAGELMLNALRAVRADRPSVHSDAVWLLINKAIDQWEASAPGAMGDGK